ncbi:MAG: hypothetical protein C4589_08150 [Peptococcaceae bacterium]|nr:MAG: hypothetical protein C4589_08150 [Peptococcaceae bacterium]
MFERISYKKLTPSISLCYFRKWKNHDIISFNWFTDDERYQQTFHLREDETWRLLCEDLEIHFLELAKVKKLDRQPKDALEAWLMYLNNLEGKEMEAIAM